ncbi:hypothetical protein [Compostibacter hankyongensis]|uniref:VCBS repeat-containing protein n=1 Tax=Compostibacter hankyongensis TaxID=1007089 RepID=A0ABP8G7R7_9BACT
MKQRLLFTLLAGLSASFAAAQSPSRSSDKTTGNQYWNSDLKIVPFRLPLPPAGYKPVYIDLDGDGDPDILKSMTKDSIPVLWVDDDDDMKEGDWEGDTDSDCLLIDRNKDGKYGSFGDLVIDWSDTDGDQLADMQVIADYPSSKTPKAWPNGHYMWVLDTDHDQVFNYVDWNTFRLESWEHSGTSDFFPDYSGQSMFMKVHAATNRIADLRLNWENPFLFYDPDKDGLSEMAVRLVDPPGYFNDPKQQTNPETMRLSGKVNWVSIAVDLDNDNGTGDEFDFDFTLGFRGEGFDYRDQVHTFKNMGGLAAADSFFLDPRFRHLDQLIYADHEHALPLIFNRGKWDQVYFVYDEDDDCHRWERVEFLDPLDPFKTGTRKGGIDNNPQSDPAGDRGEWDLDNSGKGQLYISRFDGRMHLYGAEWGCWRIDQEAAAYQGWDRRIIKTEPKTFATVKYEDSDNNGFFDKIRYDLDGDTTFEQTVDLKSLGIDDRCELIDVSRFSYRDYTNLQKKTAEQLWQNAQAAVKAAKQYGLNTAWYAKLLSAYSVQEKYHNGYWLQFYIYKDLEDLFMRKGDRTLLKALNKAYYGSDWKSLTATR